MTRAFDEQLELDFDSEQKPIDQALVLPVRQVSASIVCFTSHVQNRRARENEAKDAKLLERIASRVRRFK